MTFRPKRIKPYVPAGTIEQRLLEILRVGGARKLAILRAWALKAGFTAQTFEVSVGRLEHFRSIERFTRTGPTCEDSGPYLQLVLPPPFRADNRSA